MEGKQVIEWGTKIGMLGGALEVFDLAKGLIESTLKAGVALIALGGILLAGFIYLVHVQVERSVQSKILAELKKAK